MLGALLSKGQGSNKVVGINLQSCRACRFDLRFPTPGLPLKQGAVFLWFHVKCSKKLSRTATGLELWILELVALSGFFPESLELR